VLPVYAFFGLATAWWWQRSRRRIARERQLVEQLRQTIDQV
jgi:hypothetical protein